MKASDKIKAGTPAAAGGVTASYGKDQPKHSSSADSSLAADQHDRSNNPIDGAPRGSIGAAINEDAARYKNGPGPV